MSWLNNINFLDYILSESDRVSVIRKDGVKTSVKPETLKNNPEIYKKIDPTQEQKSEPQEAIEKYFSGILNSSIIKKRRINKTILKEAIKLINTKKFFKISNKHLFAISSLIDRSEDKNWVIDGKPIPKIIWEKIRKAYVIEEENLDKFTRYYNDIFIDLAINSAKNHKKINFGSITEETVVKVLSEIEPKNWPFGLKDFIKKVGLNLNEKINIIHLGNKTVNYKTINDGLRKKQGKIDIVFRQGDREIKISIKSNMGAAATIVNFKSNNAENNLKIMNNCLESLIPNSMNISGEELVKFKKFQENIVSLWKEVQRLLIEQNEYGKNTLHERTVLLRKLAAMIDSKSGRIFIKYFLTSGGATSSIVDDNDKPEYIMKITPHGNMIVESVDEFIENSSGNGTWGGLFYIDYTGQKYGYGLKLRF